MSKENSRERIIQLAFGTYPEAKEFHFTSDDQAFSEENDAKNHAATLKNKSVELVKRSEVKKSKEADGAKEGAGVVDLATDAGKDAGKGVADDERAALVEEYETLSGKKATHNIGIPKLKAAIEKARAALKEKEESGKKEPIKIIVTQEILDASPELGAAGIEVGDEIESSED